jgi:hypothetical protein
VLLSSSRCLLKHQTDNVSTACYHSGGLLALFPSLSHPVSFASILSTDSRPILLIIFEAGRRAVRKFKDFKKTVMSVVCFEVEKKDKAET